MPKILLCDDSKIILTLFNGKLKKAGYDIVGTARDGEECIRLYSERSPDLLLLDITMPNKDGRECLEEVLKKNPAAKVIMISALQDKEVVESCIKTGAKGFISKSHLSKENEFEKEILPMIEKVLKAA